MLAEDEQPRAAMEFVESVVDLLFRRARLVDEIDPVDVSQVTTVELLLDQHRTRKGDTDDSGGHDAPEAASTSLRPGHASPGIRDHEDGDVRAETLIRFERAPRQYAHGRKVLTEAGFFFGGQPERRPVDQSDITLPGEGTVGAVMLPSIDELDEDPATEG